MNKPHQAPELAAFAKDLLKAESLKNLQRHIIESAFDVAFYHLETSNASKATESQLCTLREILYFFWRVEDAQEND